MKLSIVIPAYNEAAYLETVIDRILIQQLTGVAVIEIVIIDDGSLDATFEVATKLSKKDPTRIKIIRHQSNQGKGAAVRTSFQHVTGDVILIQDADLEYDPKDYPKLIAPILSGMAQVVYGSRFSGSRKDTQFRYCNMLGNRILTLVSNLLGNLNLTDMETGYKVFRKEILEDLDLREDRFGFEPEITAKLARLNCTIHEVGIGYHGRTHREGKKISWRDGVWALWCIFKYNVLFRRKVRREIANQLESAAVVRTESGFLSNR